jgi:hypothetical protein
MAEKKKRVWCTLKQKMDSLDQLNKGESLQKLAKDLGLEIQQSKAGKKIERTFSHFP